MSVDDVLESPPYLAMLRMRGFGGAAFSADPTNIKFGGFHHKRHREGHRYSFTMSQYGFPQFIPNLILGMTWTVASLPW